jgi:RND family efflux transporter MFP subunit
MNESGSSTDAAYTQRMAEITHSTESGRKWGLIAAGIFSAGILGFVLLQVLSSDPVQVPRDNRAPLVQVVPVVVQKGPIPIRGDGPVRPRAQVTIIAQVSGEVAETSDALVTGGSFKKGDTLAQIDSRSYRAALTQAQADRAARKADLDFAERQLERDDKLARSGAASERRRDETLNQRDRAQSQIAGLDALIAMRAIDLERTTITAPFDGRVFTESVDVGSVVQPGAEIARIYANDIFEIVVPMSDREASLIPGLWDETMINRAPASATLPYRGNLYIWDGYVDRVEAGIDPDTRTIDVVVRIPNPTQRGRLKTTESTETAIAPLADAPPLLAGAYAAIEIEGVTLSYAMVPRAALRENDTIWLVNADDTLDVVTIEVVQDQGDHIAIRGPELNTGARVVVSDLGIATDGLAVQAVNGTALSQ